MKDRVVVDTSCWIEYFNRPESEVGKEVEILLQDDRVVIVGCVIAELLQGAKKKEEFEALKDSLGTISYLAEKYNTWEEVGRLAFELRRKGVTIPLTDCLIAALIQEEACSIFTLDSHFKSIPKCKNLQKWKFIISHLIE